ncbi:hypothetical protein NP233_g11557 [Leucocoprinus birnbaumii]|uniref:F-box domain-containing protein n=1 Tax=Leucocoprinus birnbaumii TaxID=56174 RepID=A0AAD5VGJ1_9AGAR|nr:hypothetical protein NP233_g11557 [Leucocoprinus birnbaumii]
MCFSTTSSSPHHRQLEYPTYNASAREPIINLRHKNVVQSPIYILPPEILSLIFQFTCLPLDFSRRYPLGQEKPDKRLQFILGAVSAIWREITLSTPQLWTFVDLNVRTTTLECTLEILYTYFKRSGNLLMAIGLNFFPDPEGKHVFPTFPQHSQRIHQLHINNLPSNWTNILASSFENLRHLTAFDPFHDLLLDVPCSHLTLMHTTRPVVVHCATVTTLCLIRMHEDFCLKLLRECVNLIEFSCTNPQDSPTAAAEQISPLPKDPFELPHLKSFEWPVWNLSEFDRAMLQHIRMPALHTLYWVEEDIQALEASDPRITFYDHLPSKTLANLYLVSESSDVGVSSVFSDFICRVPSVSYLHATDHGGRVLNCLFERLTIIEELHERPIALPNLETISIYDSGPKPFRTVDFAGLIQMCKSSLCKRSFPVKRLSLLEIAIEPKREVAWPFRLRFEFLELVAKGLDVKITNTGVPVDWLPQVTSHIESS